MHGVSARASATARADRRSDRRRPHARRTPRADGALSPQPVAPDGRQRQVRCRGRGREEDRNAARQAGTQGDRETGGEGGRERPQRWRQAGGGSCRSPPGRPRRRWAWR
eukprot:1570217-Rhodomonas_salina.1